MKISRKRKSLNRRDTLVKEIDMTPHIERVVRETDREISKGQYKVITSKEDFMRIFHNL